MGEGEDRDNVCMWGFTYSLKTNVDCDDEESGEEVAFQAIGEMYSPVSVSTDDRIDVLGKEAILVKPKKTQMDKNTTLLVRLCDGILAIRAALSRDMEDCWTRGRVIADDILSVKGTERGTDCSVVDRWTFLPRGRLSVVDADLRDISEVKDSIISEGIPAVEEVLICLSKLVRKGAVSRGTEPSASVPPFRCFLLVRLCDFVLDICFVVWGDNIRLVAAELVMPPLIRVVRERRICCVKDG